MYKSSQPMVFQSGAIGHLLTMKTIHVLAGQSVAIDLGGVFRLSPLRRNLVVDPYITLSAFYRPHRHSYGQSWIDFIKDGVDENITFTGIDLGTGDICSYLGGPYEGTINRALVEGYNEIWNRYYVHPTWDEDYVAKDFVPPENNNFRRLYGYPCGHLPNIWNSPIKPEVDDDDLNVDIVNNKMDLTKFSQQQARLFTERRREFFAQRYNDVLKATFGTNVNIDADERPDMIARNDFYLSGYDVDGTDQASLGQYSGKAASAGRLRIPRRRYSEHGWIYLMALVRFPCIHHGEVDYLSKKADFTYGEMTGDDKVLANEPPIRVDLNDYFGNGTGFLTDGGLSPYGQWHRYESPTVHHRYRDLDGFAFLGGKITDTFQQRYINQAAYDSVFQTDQLGHWQFQGSCVIEKSSSVPAGTASIFAGTR